MLVLHLQAGNFLDKIVTFCAGMGIGKHSLLVLVPAFYFSCVSWSILPAGIYQIAASHCAAFWKGWDMTLVILAAMPVLIVVGAAVGTVSASLGKTASGAALLCAFKYSGSIIELPM